MPLALPLAVLVFLGAFFPYIGATVTGLLAVLVALADGGFTIALGVLAVVVGVQALEGNVIEPLITGRMVRLRPFVVIVVLVDLERQRRDALLVLLDQLRLVLRADVEGGERVAVAVLVDQLGEPVTLVR